MPSSTSLLGTATTKSCEASIKSGKMKKVKVQDSIREEVEKIAKAKCLKMKSPGKLPSSAISPPPSTADNSRLVVHWLGHGRRCKMCHKMTDNDWSPTLLSYLQGKMVTYSSTIQSCMWPALTKLQSVVGVAGKEQGKTVGWVLPLVNSLLDKEMYSGLPRGEGPRAIVLCPGHVTAGKVGETLETVCEEGGLGLKIVTASRGRKVDQDSVEFVNGCDVLVSNPARVVQLVREGVTGLDRCCHLVVEDADITLEIHKEAVEELFLLWRRKRVTQQERLPDQVVVVGEEWSEAVQFLTEKILIKRWNPAIVFGSMLEAAVYSQLPILTSFHLSAQEKLSSLLTLLRNNRQQRVVICCTSWRISSDLHKYLEDKGVMAMVLRKVEDQVDLNSDISVWLDHPTGVPLLVSDEVSLPSIPGVADCLVNWDMPHQSKKIFSIRFRFIKNAIQQVPEKGHLRRAEVHLLLDSKDRHSFATLVPLLRRCGGDVPAGVLDHVDNDKHGMGRLCERMVEGRLDCSPHCVKRHWLDKRMDQDQGAGKRLEGVIQFLVLRVETPVLYWVRVMDSMYDRDFQMRVLRMGRHFCRKESCVPISHQELVLGLFVAVEGDEGVYHRARVVSLEYKECQEDKLIKVKLFLVDEGVAGSFHPSRISRLPVSLGLDSFVAGATPVTVTGILPPDKDPDWSLECAELVSGYLTPVQRIAREEVCRGRVLLHTTNMLWVDRCQMMVKQPTIARFVLHFETYSWLVSQYWAVPNPEHAEHLHKLAVKGGLEVAEYHRGGEVDEIEDDLSCSQVDKTPDCEASPSPRTAFLPQHTAVLVCMSECVTPGQFYLQLSAQLASLTRLEQEVATWATEHEESGHLLLPVTGQIVLARIDQYNEYLRAEVRHVGDRLVVFMVDTGEIATVLMEDTLPCPESLAYKIPHQAIQCSLAGVRPVSGDWSVPAGDQLFDLTRDSLTDSPLALVCQVSQVTSTGFSVRLTSTESGPDVDLASELVAAGLAGQELTELEDRLDIQESSMDLDEDFDTPNKMFNLERVLEACASDAYHDQLCVPTLLAKQIPVNTACPDTPVPASSPITPTQTVPADMPSLALVSTVSQYRTVTPRLTWRQSKACLFLTVQFNTVRDLEPVQVHVMVTYNMLVVQVLEHYMEDTILHTFPGSELELWGEVVPSQTKVVVKQRVVNIQLTPVDEKHCKQVDLPMEEVEWSWPRLGRAKCDWIRRDLEGLEENSCDVLTCQSEELKGEVHPLTGEKILQEELFDTSDEKEESITDDDQDNDGEEM